MACRDLPVGFANAGDAQSLAIMSRDLIEAGLGWEYRRDRIAALIGDAEHVALVTRDGPRVAGFAIMSFRDEHAHLVLLAVRPTHQRRGIARAMLSWLTESALVAGVASMHVELRATNAAAHALYLDAGFSETLRVPGYYRGREAAVRMLKLLRAPNATMPAWRPPTLDRR
ncbi:MAG: GNAT family N-acetyltransferase [Burkholderiales bacterium]|nr:GNAT family N-acetyltransferase [Burkholderiales bacterium]